ncbi:hypothetical protein L1O03_03265 [Corynebacterium uropygiale]|uniref:Uncharacterized protein n=1 Tax=Corynebacterium uropygiale TaxID=1775911 RepID=A0A9X1TZX6_9CORY|nr:hypothetical protein [Corynebacterium uropygiale]MCF4006199.1 hypothetical protein [Corynebacterium uropygiale]
MHYTSWTRRTEHGADLLVEDGPDVLAHFSHDGVNGTALVQGETWTSVHDPEKGASLTRPSGETYELIGQLTKDHEFQASLRGTPLRLINEQRNDWIIEDASGTKIAQFSGGNNGVRRAILEFESDHEGDLETDQTIALSWFVRLLLEHRLDKSSWAILGTVLLFAIVGIIAILFIV